MHYLLVLQLLILTMLANGSPVIAERILGRRFAQPIDGNIKFVDGKPLFGASKTIRGIVVSILATTACAPLLGIDWGIGAIVAVAAMIGDLFSSFVKRRLGMPPSSQAIGLDQVPESLFPLIACRQLLSLTALDIAACTAIFFVGDVLLSRLLFRWQLRDRPH
jgi:CDP-diglyceride synthetase